MTANINVTELKVASDFPLFDDEVKENYLMRFCADEPDNIIPFRDPQFIDLTKCF
jgi:hypothetical protein